MTHKILLFYLRVSLCPRPDLFDFWSWLTDWILDQTNIFYFYSCVSSFYVYISRLICVCVSNQGQTSTYPTFFPYPLPHFCLLLAVLAWPTAPYRGVSSLTTLLFISLSSFHFFSFDSRSISLCYLKNKKNRRRVERRSSQVPTVFISISLILSPQEQEEE